MENRIQRGNFDETSVDHRGWVLGHFIEKNSPLHSTDLEIKWSRHKKGEKKEKPAQNKSAKTLFVLFSGKIKFVFPDHLAEEILEKQGDYIYYDPGVNHAWEVMEDCLAINVRWPSLQNDQV